LKQSQYRRIWFSLIKLSIVFGAGFYIYKRVFIDSEIDSKVFFFEVDNFLFKNWQSVLLLISLSIINWVLEIWKWKVLVTHLRPITFFEAAKQSLSSHTVSLVTPFKMGEYGGKVLYFPKQFRKRILLLSFIGNSAQLMATLLFGILGLVFFLKTYEVTFNVYKLRRIGYLIAFLIIMLFAGTKFGNSKSGYYQKALLFLKKMRWSIKGKIVCLSILRYLIFSHQFYFLLIIFGIEVPYEVAILLIFTMYFLATLLPVFSLFDFVIKGSIAIYLFSFVGANDVKIITISILMWLLNFLIPALVGSYFVFSFKPNIGTKFA